VTSRAAVVYAHKNETIDVITSKKVFKRAQDLVTRYGDSFCPILSSQAQLLLLSALWYC